MFLTFTLRKFFDLHRCNFRTPGRASAHFPEAHRVGDTGVTAFRTVHARRGLHRRVSDAGRELSLPFENLIYGDTRVL